MKSVDASQTRRLLSAGIILALVVALPLFIWAIITQRFELRKRAATGEPTPILAITPSTRDYGPVASNTSVDFTAVVSNVGAISTGGTIALWISGVDAGAFQIVGGSCVSGTTVLAAAQSCTVTIRFPTAGTTLGDKQATLNVSATLAGLASMTLRGLVITAPTSNFCAGQPNGTSCYVPDPNCPVCAPGQICPKRPCRVIPGTCQNQVCIETKPSPSPTPNPCEGQPNGTSCQVYQCLDKGLNVYCTPTIINGVEVGCPAMPCSAANGVCQNNQCVIGQPACPSGDKGNLNCDASGLINAIDLSVLLSQWRTGSCPAPTPQPNIRSADLNGDCNINAIDLSILLSNWKPI